MMKVLLSEETIQARVREIADQINDEYKDKRPMFLVTLSGAVLFASDLFKQITAEGAEIEFCKLSSYHGNKSTGDVNVRLFPDIGKLRDRHLIVVEDIVDTGLTMKKMWSILEIVKAASVSVVTLLWKKQFSPDLEDRLDYVGFPIDDHFVVGYGLDLSGRFRNFRDVRVYEEQEEEES